MVDEAASTIDDGDLETARERLSSVIDTYLYRFDDSDIDLLSIVVTMLERIGDHSRVLRGLRTFGNIANRAAASAGLVYYRALAISGEKALSWDFVVGDPSETMGHHTLIACIPKTGSTFLQRSMIMATGAAASKLGLSYANEENLLYPSTVATLVSKNIVAQEHCRATPPNLAVAQAFDMRVIVLVRNIFDSIVSMRDMLKSDTNGSVVALVQDELQNLDNEAQLNAVITKWAHWQLDFYTSWVRAERNGLIDAQFWTYEDVMQNKVVAVQEICRQAGLNIDRERLQASLENVDGDADLSRKNVGISGLGRQLMTDRQISSIQSKTRFYPAIDFSPMGL